MHLGGRTFFAHRQILDVDGAALTDGVICTPLLVRESPFARMRLLLASVHA